MQLPLISHKASRFTESVIRGMTVEARKYGAINLAQGMPDFPAPREIKDAACRAIEDDINQYAITWGVEEPARGDRRTRRLAPGPRGRSRDRDHRHLRQHRGDAGLVAVADQSRRRGDPHPAVLRELLARLRSGRRDAAVRAAPAARLAVRPDELAAAFNDKTKAIILCNPNNPTGTVFTRDDLEEVAALCRKWDVIAITDEIYEHIIYDGRAHVALAALEGMRERSVTISGMSKTYAVTGWRVGTIIAPPGLTHAFRQVHDFVSIGAAAPLQEAGAVAYRLPRPYYAQLAAEYQARRDRFCKALWEIGFEFEAPQGAYYIMAGIAAFGVTDDVDFARYLVRDIGVATVPGSSFFQDKALGRPYVRFCFCKRDETLDEAARRLRKLKVLV